MSDETTGVTTNAAELETSAASPTSATTDPAAPSTGDGANATASAVGATTQDSAAAANGSGSAATATAIDPMDEAMQQMPPLDEIEVPGGEEKPRRGGRGGGGGGRDGFGGGNTLPDLRAGQVVQGTVVHIDREGVLVDIGMKSEGLIRPNELSREPVANVEDVVKPGDRIDVVVMEPDRNDGTILLSKKRADFEKAWDRVQEALGTGVSLQAMVSDRVKGGLVVDLGIRGFVPASHVGNGKLKNLEKFVGQSVPLKVLEVDRHNRKVVLSHRLATEEEREKEKQTTIQSLGEGQTRTGTVRRVTDYGAFVDLGGIDGLLHVSEMGWTRIKHPSDVVKVGQEVQVMILRLNLQEGRVSLGMRQILPDPWLDVAEKFHVNDVVEGEVTRLVPFGAFVLLEGGVEGIIPNSELAHRRIAKPADVVDAGQMVQVKVIDVRPEERRLTLSLRALQPREAGDDYRGPAAAGPRPAGGAPGAAPGATTEEGAGRSREKRDRRRGRGGDEEDFGGDFRQYMGGGGGGTGGGVTLGDMFGELFSARGGAAAGGGAAKKGGAKRRRDVDEDEDFDPNSFEDDFDPNAPTDAADVDAEAAGVDAEAPAVDAEASATATDTTDEDETAK
jgi:predicted RNA-binding protein with RPS1 domain